jgi:hypothetical protein
MRVPPRGVSRSDVHVHLLCEPVAEDSAGAEVVVSAHAEQHAKDLAPSSGEGLPERMPRTTEYRCQPMLAKIVCYKSELGWTWGEAGQPRPTRHWNQG